MRRTVCIILFFMTLTALWAQEGTMRAFNGRTFSFGFLEPIGWMIDNEAAQLAHFVLHREGMDWRDAPAIVFIRLVDPQRGEHEQEESVRDEDLEAFVKRNVESFKAVCPAFEIKDVKLSRANLGHEFIVKSYDCPGMRHEISAVTEVPDYFVLLVLSSRSEKDLKAALPKYEQVVSSFYWRERETTAQVPDNR